MASASSHTCRSQLTSTYSNPVINQDFPDPNCIKVADTFFVFATNFGEMQASSSHVQLATTNDLVTYQLQPDALPKLPSWAKTGKTWAPNVTHVHTTDGSLFVLYFVAWDTVSDRQAIGIARQNKLTLPVSR
jgi:beta-xylosidase